MEIEQFRQVVTESQGKPLSINYTNWRGVTEDRVIKPQDIMFMKTMWHPEETWCVLAFCHYRQEERVFCIKDIHTAKVESAQSM